MEKYQFDSTKLKKAMEVSGVNVVELSRLTGVTHSFIYGVTNGRYNVSQRLNNELNKVFSELLDENIYKQQIKLIEAVLKGDN